MVAVMTMVVVNMLWQSWSLVRELHGGGTYLIVMTKVIIVGDMLVIGGGGG